MLVNTWHAAEIARQRRSDRLKQAEYQRFRQQVAVSKPSLTTLVRRRFGAWLVAAGHRLQAQHPPLRSAHEW